jgi:hypothetical protein
MPITNDEHFRAEIDRRLDPGKEPPKYIDEGVTGFWFSIQLVNENRDVIAEKDVFLGGDDEQEEAEHFLDLITRTFHLDDDEEPREECAFRDYKFCDDCGA